MIGTPFVGRGQSVRKKKTDCLAHKTAGMIVRSPYLPTGSSQKTVCTVVGFGTFAFAGCRGFIGPIPLPLVIRYAVADSILPYPARFVKGEMQEFVVQSRKLARNDVLHA